MPPRGPQICPSQTEALMQKKEETPTTSHPMLGGEGSMIQGAHSNPLILMEQGMVGPGWNRPRPALRKNGGETDPQSITSHCLGDGKPTLPILSPSRIMREGTRQYSSSTGMQVSVPQPIMMWLPREWPAITLIWSWAWQRALTHRYSV